MTTRLLTTVAFFFAMVTLNAQTTNIEVYNIMQLKCASCHSNANPQSGLDLEGEGATVAERALDVHNKIFNVSPDNAYALDKGYKQIYPGRPDRSFMFRKISNGFENMITAHEDEAQAMPPYPNDQLTDYEKEVFRQWILFGAKPNGNPVDLSMLEDYYTNGGEESFPTPPDAPAPGEGFQIKMGPFFIPQSSEREYFQKYEIDLGEAKDVNRVHTIISNYSHHFITYKFSDPNEANNVADGFRPYNNFSQLPIVTSVQETSDIQLPNKTAFFWDQNEVLDLNVHYINYSPTTVYKAEGYLNIYTQPQGTALKQMYTVLVPNVGIFIPNNGNLDTETAYVNAFGNPFVWQLGGHTHQLGTGYKIWKQTPSGDYGDLIYDASCTGGIPGCVSPYFDYAHIPARTFPEFLGINLSHGIIHEATYVNNTDQNVAWGPLSTDEMMLFAMMYVNDTTGLNVGAPSTSIEDLEPLNTMNDIQLYPNPVEDDLQISMPNLSEKVGFKLFDLLGREVKAIASLSGNEVTVSMKNLKAGMYLYEFTSENGERKTGKLYKE